MRLSIIEGFFKTIPPSFAPQNPAYGPGRKHSLLPALAKNMPQAYFLNASRPLHKGGIGHYLLLSSLLKSMHHLICLRVGIYSLRRAQMRQSFI